MPFEARSTTQAWVITVVAGVLAVWAPGAVSYALNAAMMAGHSPPAWYIAFAMVWGLVGLVIVFSYGVFTPAPALWGPPVVAGAASAVSTVMFFWIGGGLQTMQGLGAFSGFMVAAMVFSLLWGLAVTAGVALGGAAVGRSRRRKQAVRRTQEPPPLPSFERLG